MFDMFDTHVSLDLEVVLLTLRYQIPDGVSAGEEGLMSTRFLAEARQVQVWDSATNWKEHNFHPLLYFQHLSTLSFFPSTSVILKYFWHIRCRWHLGGETLWAEIKIESWVCDPVRGGFLCTAFAGLSGFPSQIHQDTWESKVATNIHKHSEPWYNRHDMKKMTKLELQFFNQPRGGRSFATDRMKSKLGQILWHWISQAISQEPSDGVYLLYAEDTFYCKGLSLLSLLASKLSIIHGSLAWTTSNTCIQLQHIMSQTWPRW